MKRGRDCNRAGKGDGLRKEKVEARRRMRNSRKGIGEQKELRKRELGGKYRVL
jgi:hypothetical protein